MTPTNHTTTLSCMERKNIEASSVEKLHDQLIDHVNSATTAPTPSPTLTTKAKKPTTLKITMSGNIATSATASTSATTTARAKHTEAKNIKKLENPTNTRKNGQHVHYLEVGRDFILGYIDIEGKLVCKLCQKDFVSMKYLYWHLKGHSYADVETFFASYNLRNEVLDIKVADQPEGYDEDVIEGAKTLVLMANGRRSMEEITLEELVGCLLKLALGKGSTAESSVCVEELERNMQVERNVVHEFDLNVAPDMEEEDHQ